jgi:Cd2+/Zn2+-exporting ATPase
MQAKKKDLNHTKPKVLKALWAKGATAKCLVCEDETIYVGKLDFIKEHQPVDKEAEKIVEQLSSQGKTSVVVSFGNGVAGIIGLMDEIKPDSEAALKEIEAMNIEPVMLTGDSEKAANYVAQQVGIKKIFGNMLPENKAEKIKELLQQYKFVAMVGDGINDAPALAQSTVGIAMGAAGSDTAIETANIALMNDKLSLIPFLIRLSQKTLRRIKFNTIGAIAVKLDIHNTCFHWLQQFSFRHSSRRRSNTSCNYVILTSLNNRTQRFFLSYFLCRHTFSSLPSLFLRVAKCGT